MILLAEGWVRDSKKGHQQAWWPSANYRLRTSVLVLWNNVRPRPFYILKLCDSGAESKGEFANFVCLRGVYAFAMAPLSLPSDTCELRSVLSNLCFLSLNLFLKKTSFVHGDVERCGFQLNITLVVLIFISEKVVWTCFNTVVRNTSPLCRQHRDPRVRGFLGMCLCQGLKLQTHIDTAQALKSTGICWCSVNQWKTSFHDHVNKFS